MKRNISIILIVLFVFTFIGCGSTKTIDGIEYDTYGFINQSDKKNPDVEYRLIIGNIVWSVILCETIVAPLYFAGFSIYEPIGKMDHTKPKGAL